MVCGASGVGKTTLARTLNAPTTLFMDLEAGDAAIEGHPIDVVRPRTWAECRDLACFLGGPNPSLADDQPYSRITLQLCGADLWGYFRGMEEVRYSVCGLYHRSRAFVLSVVLTTARGAV